MRNLLAISLCIYITISYGFPVNSSGSGYDGDDEDGDSMDSLCWIERTREGNVSFCSSEDISNFLQYLLSHQANSRLEATSNAPQQMEDGPLNEILPKPETKTRVSEYTGDFMEKIDGKEIYFYPNYAIGILENGCTAFLISPRHALTTAHCVYDYNNQTWNEQLDFYRGKVNNSDLSKMDWSHVVIPCSYHSDGDGELDWAIITYAHDTPSPVWLRIAYSPDVSDKVVTIYSYLDKTQLYSIICRSNIEQNNHHFITLTCGSDLKFDGGPVLRGYQFMRSKTPPVYGISVSHQFSYLRKAIKFDSQLFWLLCYLMSTEEVPIECKNV